ncbi:MAG TPA: hypothetical protein VHE81_10825, partial [Lacipirellulaceae bacterium]|nr:hypothetical protein [Lacipirellulaceae bacterium]
MASLSRIKNPPHSAIFFILDGLDNLPDSEESTAKALFSLLPLGRRGFRFLISGSRAAKYLNSNSPKCYGEFSVTGFTQEEASTYLNDLLPVDEVKKLYALSKLPGYFANVRPIIQAQGKLPDPPLSTVQKVYEYEWEKIGGDSQTERLLAYLAFTKSTPSCVTAAKFLSISPPEVEALITRTAFIDLRGDIICFKHDSVAAFCRGKVKHLEQQVVDRLIEGFLHNSTTDEGVSQLPELFAQAGRYDELLAYMDDAYLVNALRQRRAARFIQEKALIGLKAAVKRENSEQVIRFGLQGANLDELYFDDHWAPRIQAFISIGALPRAFEIARSFTLPEDRLQALCHIAIEQKELNGRAEETLLDEITREYALLDKEHLGERAYDIATDLVKLLPKLALELIRRQSADT